MGIDGRVSPVMIRASRRDRLFWSRFPEQTVCLPLKLGSENWDACLGLWQLTQVQDGANGSPRRRPSGIGRS
jgi:hypothetical protein